MTSLNRSSSVAGTLAFVSGLYGFGRIWVLGLMPGHEGPSDSVVSDFG